MTITIKGLVRGLFDKNREYIDRWINTNSKEYPKEIIDHKTARLRCLETYKKYLD